MEIWKDIKGYEGYYQVSNLGRVKSLERIITVTTEGKPDYYRKHSERIIKPGDNGRGYMYVFLYKNCISHHALVHRLVAEAFISNLENKPEVDHINTKRHDNRVENLKWASSSENNLNPITRYKNFRSQPKGVDCKKSKKVLQFHKDGSFIKEWGSVGEVSRALGIDGSFLSACCRGKYKSGYGFIWKYAN